MKSEWVVLLRRNVPSFNLEARMVQTHRGSTSSAEQIRALEFSVHRLLNTVLLSHHNLSPGTGLSGVQVDLMALALGVGGLQS